MKIQPTNKLDFIGILFLTLEVFQLNARECFDEFSIFRVSPFVSLTLQFHYNALLNKIPGEWQWIPTRCTFVTDQ